DAGRIQQQPAREGRALDLGGLDLVRRRDGRVGALSRDLSARAAGFLGPGAGAVVDLDGGPGGGRICRLVRRLRGEAGGCGVAGAGRDGADPHVAGARPLRADRLQAATYGHAEDHRRGAAAGGRGADLALLMAPARSPVVTTSVVSSQEKGE